MCHCRVEDTYANFSFFQEKQDKLTKQGVSQDSCAISTLQLLVPEQAGLDTFVQHSTMSCTCVSAVVIWVKLQFLHPR